MFCFWMPSVLKSNQLIGIFTIKAQDGGHRSDRSCSVVEDVVHIVVQCRGREERDEQQEKEEQEVWAAPALWALFPRPRATRPTSALLHSFLEHCNVPITIEISIELLLITHSAVCILLSCAAWSCIKSFNWWVCWCCIENCQCFEKHPPLHSVYCIGR